MISGMFDVAGKFLAAYQIGFRIRKAEKRFVLRLTFICASTGRIVERKYEAIHVQGFRMKRSIFGLELRVHIDACSTHQPSFHPG
jgi:hypothetical protein